MAGLLYLEAAPNKEPGWHRRTGRDPPFVIAGDGPERDRIAADADASIGHPPGRLGRSGGRPRLAGPRHSDLHVAGPESLAAC